MHTTIRLCGSVIVHWLAVAQQSNSLGGNTKESSLEKDRRSAIIIMKDCYINICIHLRKYIILKHSQSNCLSVHLKKTFSGFTKIRLLMHLLAIS